MLQSFLSSIPTYSKSCFKLPQGLCKRIQSVLTRFWWDASPNKRKMCWIAWSRLIKSKREGGLRLQDIQCFKDALLAKQTWRIITKPNYLLRWTLMGKYCNHESLLEVSLMSSCSHGWRGIIIGRDLLEPNLGMSIGNRKDVSVWRDSWISSSAQIRPFGPHREDEHDMMVDELLDINSMEWDKDKIQLFLPNFEQQILCLKSIKTGACDHIYWLPNPSWNTIPSQATL